MSANQHEPARQAHQILLMSHSYLELSVMLGAVISLRRCGCRRHGRRPQLRQCGHACSLTSNMFPEMQWTECIGVTRRKTQRHEQAPWVIPLSTSVLLVGPCIWSLSAIKIDSIEFAEGQISVAATAAAANAVAASVDIRVSEREVVWHLQTRRRRTNLGAALPKLVFSGRLHNTADSS